MVSISNVSPFQSPHWETHNRECSHSGQRVYLGARVPLPKLVLPYVASKALAGTASNKWEWREEEA